MIGLAARPALAVLENLSWDRPLRWLAAGLVVLASDTASACWGCPGDVIIAVVDADGHLDPHAVADATEFFADPAVGAVQIGVRINNRDRSTLARMQDREFVIYTEVFQRGAAAPGQRRAGRQRPVRPAVGAALTGPGAMDPQPDRGPGPG